MHEAAIPNDLQGAYRWGRQNQPKKHIAIMYNLSFTKCREWGEKTRS